MVLFRFIFFEKNENRYNGSYVYFSFFVCGLGKGKRMLSYSYSIFYCEIENTKNDRTVYTRTVVCTTMLFKTAIYWEYIVMIVSVSGDTDVKTLAVHSPSFLQIISLKWENLIYQKSVRHAWNDMHGISFNVILNPRGSLLTIDPDPDERCIYTILQKHQHTIIINNNGQYRNMSILQMQMTWWQHVHKYSHVFCPGTNRETSWDADCRNWLFSPVSFGIWTPIHLCW